MAKEQEREELHRTIWQIANDLRGSVDGWDFKSYVLGFLFYRFISENLTLYINKEEQRTGNNDFDYAKISDKDAEFGRADTVKEKGFYILPCGLFENVRRNAKNDTNLNETLSTVFKNIENSAKGTESEDDLRGLFDDIDVNSNPLLINDPRFSPAGVLAPKSKADLAFTMHMLSWLATSGTAAIVERPGVLYRDGAEQKIRKYLIDNNYIDSVIQLPPDLFFGTSIATCIIVLKKSKKDNATLFIDASAEFVRGGNKNKLTEANRKRMPNAFIARKDEPYFAKFVLNGDIAQNEYNIAESSFVEQENTTEEVDILKLNAHIAEIVIKQHKLRTAIDEIVADLEEGTL